MREEWRAADAVVVPDVIGLRVRDADEVAHAAGLTLAQPNPDGPPLAALTWPDEYWVTRQQPRPGVELRRWDPLVVEWSDDPAGLSGVREPRRPRPTEILGEGKTLPDDAAAQSAQPR